jgi:hypothetical protein
VFALRILSEDVAPNNRLFGQVQYVPVSALATVACIFVKTFDWHHAQKLPELRRALGVITKDAITRR